MTRTVIVVLPFVLGVLAAQEVGRNAAMQGRVTDVLGDPIPAARIVAMVGDRMVARVATDGEGVYHLAVPATGVELRVSAPGKATLHQEHRSLPALRVANMTLEDGCRVHGQVLDAAGGPIAGAVVLVVAGQESRETSCAANGAFEFTSLPMQNAVIRTCARGHSVQRELRLAGDTRCDLTMPDERPGIRIAHVRGLPAEAIARTRIEMTSPDLVLLPGRGSLALRADCSAEFIVHESCLLRVIAPGFEASPLGMLIDPRGHRPLEFVVAPAAAGPPNTTVVHGRVIDAHGRSVAGLRLVGQDRGELEVGSTRVGADGRFVLQVSCKNGELCRIGLELGEFQIADDEARVKNGSSWVDVYIDPAYPVDISVERASGVLGGLHTASGEHGAFAEVALAVENGPADASVTAIADQNGTFDVRGLPEAKYQVTAITGTGEVITAEVDVVRGKMLAIEAWTPVPAGTIEGQVKDERGHVVPGAQVQLWCADPDAPGPRVRHLVTDRHGRFRSRGAMAGEWRASVPGDCAGGYDSIDLAAGATGQFSLRTGR